MNYEKAVEAAEFIRSKYSQEIKVAVVLGSGLGAFADEAKNAVVIPYEEIPHFSSSTVEGHAGRLVLGEVEGISVAVQQGRFHYYEGYEIAQVVFPVRAFGVLGVKNLILTNAAGSVNTDFAQGSLMLIRDHINLTGVNPLRGINDERFGARFPDMTEVYALDYQEIVISEAKKMAQEKAARKEAESGQKQSINYFLRRGVYCGLIGPNYETPAEVRMLRQLGADALGMSTVAEAITARHVGMKVIGISCITNMAAGISDDVIHHEEVMETGAKVAETFKELLRRVIAKLD
ncbi:MAG: Purine nucleoside phosphorylase @ N-Ribosylnicotinamide phosphorylase [uncultured Pyrinomonadaceae bacterium]|uniref:Purine nucleoside phosphorylase n=1 Tax=uncultured Pyrinomonadaceae bacterium TaxID=2283094 RepID=A0A6J4NLI2_9BACT|nr:MAG: Purine nucleoside phosphorylase @ N-Ribosylnicotinamide phosphorylase [uncultured Pyrinomonadaceae bacterium]